MIKKRPLIISAIFLALFLIFTILVIFVDKLDIGPINPKTMQPTEVGLATMNKAFKDAVAPNETLFLATEWGTIPAALIGFVFALIGLIQWIKRKTIKKVDTRIIALGIFYIILLLIYLLFQLIVVNYRPILVNGKLEASYPSSHTLLGVGFCSTAMMLNYRYIKNKAIAHSLTIVEGAYMLFLIIGRLLSGYHWLSDLIASVILGISLAALYYSYIDLDLAKK